MNKTGDMEILQVRSPKEIRTFIGLPWSLHKNDAYWVPPILRDEREYFNVNKNNSFKYCDTIMLLAYRAGIPVGRIMGIINHRYNDSTQTRFARFALLDSINDQQVVSRLLNRVEDWAKSFEVDRLIGPMGMTYLDPMGFQTEGFDFVPALSTYTNFPYLPELVSQSGFEVDEQLVVYRVDLDQPIPELYSRVFTRISQRAHISLLEFSTRKELKKAIIPVMTLMNECFVEIYGYSQLSQNEMIELGRKYISVLDPGLVVAARVDDKIAGFIIAMPNLTEGIRASNGILFPFGFLHILKASRKAMQLDLLIGAVAKKYQGIGIDVLMGYRMIEIAKSRGYKIIDSHLELVKNKKMTAEMKKVGGEIYKRYTLYKKDLI